MQDSSVGGGSREQGGSGDGLDASVSNLQHFDCCFNPFLELDLMS